MLQLSRVGKYHRMVVATYNMESHGLIGLQAILLNKASHYGRHIDLLHIELQCRAPFHGHLKDLLHELSELLQLLQGYL